MHLLIAEDDKLHRAFLEKVARNTLADLNVLTMAEDGAEAIQEFDAAEYDSVILDLQMPRMTGVEVAKTIWAKKPSTKILFWSNYTEEAYIRGITKIVPSAAVYGYILKSAPAEQLKLALQGVFVAEQCVIDREVRGVQQRAGDRLLGLSELEYEALVDLCLGLTDKAMAARRNVSLRGAQSRLQHLYQKLGLDKGDIPVGEWGPTYNSRTRAISLALSQGILNADALRKEEENLRVWMGRQQK
ncbi:response regulator transcription factor [Cognatishimia maritima]|uniref:DNA-binding response regulator, NarL/FixJ family, contains REC and HTH domains n=1 Tax=Cognatishimia maritima TaxID=870908 RepID=A0A1M5QG08_9RHOB|nr:response regulator transcription factor [Cognatishimia maritima]SHH13007.1 DNA-binding response regulator, NarL/FixJ family, contains REC and HTH domains [Cognatishimia maritima]